MDHSHSRSRSDSKPPPYSSAPISTSTSTSAQIQSHNRSHSHNQSQRTPAPQQRPLDTAAAAPSRPASRRRRPSSPGVVSAAFLEPRIAVVLKIPKAWRPWLFFSRLLSICPAILWGLRPALQLLLRLLLALPWKTLLEALGADVAAAGFTTDGPPETMCPAGPASLRGVLGTSKVPSTTPTYPWTEMSLGVIWYTMMTPQASPAMYYPQQSPQPHFSPFVMAPHMPAAYYHPGSWAAPGFVPGTYMVDPAAEGQATDQDSNDHDDGVHDTEAGHSQVTSEGGVSLKEE
ncbi:hypothetical protein BN1723_015329 [Verticillium longisporum]|uniref:Uncharacterized protein n=1 Tax=Verticillium longisporum TaxID=100787 RepID=A0A0G4MWI7_VERLO|nr:hypothetical protein BN1723_015329 [Verticillium longisporum]